MPAIASEWDKVSSNSRCPYGATVGSVAQEVFERYPGLIGTPTALVLAVNEEYQLHDYELADGDEVALIPPVSGGTDD